MQVKRIVALWLLAPACVIAAGRLGGEPQSYLPRVLQNVAVVAHQPAPEGSGGDPGSGAGAECPRAVLECVGLPLTITCDNGFVVHLSPAG